MIFNYTFERVKKMKTSGTLKSDLIKAVLENDTGFDEAIAKDVERTGDTVNGDEVKALRLAILNVIISDLDPDKVKEADEFDTLVKAVKAKLAISLYTVMA